MQCAALNHDAPHALPLHVYAQKGLTSNNAAAMQRQGRTQLLLSDITFGGAGGYERQGGRGAGRAATLLGTRSG
jgi:hypothetical protein